eukprot:SAG11_NODE_16802_length_537_cov_1.002283_1_plen_75_part_00
MLVLLLPTSSFTSSRSQRQATGSVPPRRSLDVARLGRDLVGIIPATPRPLIRLMQLTICPVAVAVHRAASTVRL